MAVAVLALAAAVALVAPDDAGGGAVVARVEDWELTESALNDRLEDLYGNVLYRQAREDQGRALADHVEGEPWPAPFVTEVLDAEVRAQLVRRALADRTGVVEPGDRQRAQATMATQYVGGAQLVAGGGNTLDVVLSQFMDSRPALEQAHAEAAALLRVVAAEAGLDIDSAEAVARFDQAVRDRAARTTVTVDQRHGIWDAAAARVLPPTPAEPGADTVPDDTVPDDTVPDDTVPSMAPSTLTTEVPG
jgi:hypothetical protein